VTPEPRAICSLPALKPGYNAGVGTTADRVSGGDVATGTPPASRLSVVDVEALLDAVAAVAKPVLLDFLWRPALPDPNDDMVLETGVNGRADAIVTFNRRHFVMVTKQFGLDVLSPADAIERLEYGS
jgi:hypothetical protein